MGICVACKGEKVSSSCIIWEGKEVDAKSFNELIEQLLLKTEQEEIKVDLKTVSPTLKGKVSFKDALESLIQAETLRKALEKKATTSTATNSPCTLNINALSECESCSKTECEKMQFLVDQVVLLKAEIQQIKSQI